MQIQSKQVAKVEDLTRLEEIATKTSRNDKWHSIGIAILTAAQLFQALVLIRYFW